MIRMEHAQSTIQGPDWHDCPVTSAKYSDLLALDIDGLKELIDEKNTERAALSIFGKRGGLHGLDWFGVVEGSDEFPQLCRAGFPASARRILDNAQQLTAPRAKSIRPRVHYSASGQVQPLRLFGGDLMTAFATIRRESSVSGAPTAYDVVFNCSALSHVTSEQMTWRAVSALVIAETLSNAGYPVRVRSVATSNTVYTGRDQGRGSCSVLLLSDFGQRPDLGTMSAACLGLFFRFWHWILRCSAPFVVRSGMGCTQSFGRIPDFLKEDGIGSIWIDNINSEESARQLIGRVAAMVEAGETEVTYFG